MSERGGKGSRTWPAFGLEVTPPRSSRGGDPDCDVRIHVRDLVRVTDATVIDLAEEERSSPSEAAATAEAPRAASSLGSSTAPTAAHLGTWTSRDDGLVEAGPLGFGPGLMLRRLSLRVPRCCR